MSPKPPPNQLKQQKRNSKQLMIRTHADERSVIRAAAKALSRPNEEISEGQLIYTAGLEEAGNLGFTPSMISGRHHPKGPWINKPERSASSGQEPITITVNPLHYRPIEAAAIWAEVSVPTFLLGATYAFIAAWKRSAPNNEQLKRIRLPPQYETRR
jgi:uncharacterized protein (DUF1778 family)